MRTRANGVAGANESSGLQTRGRKTDWPTQMHTVIINLLTKSPAQSRRCTLPTLAPLFSPHPAPFSVSEVCVLHSSFAFMMVRGKSCPRWRNPRRGMCSAYKLNRWMLDEPDNLPELPAAWIRLQIRARDSYVGGSRSISSIYASFLHENVKKVDCRNINR